MALFPFLITKLPRTSLSQKYRNHERIHFRQQLELLLIGFYLLYALEFLMNYLKLNDWTAAYRNISFEREAFTNESNLKYLKNRKCFAQWRHVGRD